MTQNFRYVGIDVSSRRLDASVYPGGAAQSFDNTPAGIAALLVWLKAQPDIASVGCEATGGYERAVIEALVAAGFFTRLLNAARVRKFAEALGRAKNDRLDAAVIAHFLATIPGPAVVVDRVRSDLRDLMQLHLQFNEQLTAQRNASRQMRLQAARKLAADTIRHLRRQITLVAKAIARLITSNAALARQQALLTSMRAVGPVISAGILAWLPELGEASSSQLTALVGLAPFDDDSGERRGKRSIRGGRVEVRNLLYMGALVASRHNPALRAAYENLLARGKPRKVALIAIARKMLLILNAMLASGTPWQDKTTAAPIAA
jgi:transposase